MGTGHSDPGTTSRYLADCVLLELLSEALPHSILREVSILTSEASTELGEDQSASLLDAGAQAVGERRCYRASRQVFPLPLYVHRFAV